MEFGNSTIGEHLRLQEKIEVEEECFKHIQISNDAHSGTHFPNCYGVFDNRIISTLTAILNISKTVIIGLIILLGTCCFKSDTNLMVLKPFDSMINKIRKMSKNPTAAVKEIETSAYIKEKQDQNDKNRCCFPKEEIDKTKNLETIILDKAITKIGSLLSIGLGEVGSKVLEQNLKQNNGVLNPISKGETIIGVFAVVNLSDHSLVQEILDSSYPILMNEIYEEISLITKHHGIYLQKNNGDGLLLIWKLDKRFLKISEDNEYSIANHPEVSQTVDIAIMCIIKILIRIQKAYIFDRVILNLIIN